MSSSPHVRVAVTQAEPVWFDLQATVDKTCRLIEEATINGATMITFPECWLPGYPVWLWNRALSNAFRYMGNSMSVNGDEMWRIRECAAENDIAVVFGFSEKDGSRLYMAQAIVSRCGELSVLRRKLAPSNSERAVFAPGRGSTDSVGEVVSPLDLGGPVDHRVGTLQSWEHVQPIVRYHTMSEREDIHIAAGPPLFGVTNGENAGPWSMGMEDLYTVSHNWAIKSSAFVLQCTPVVTRKGLETLKCAGPSLSRPGGGYAAVFAPDGTKISTDILDSEEGIVYADLDMDLVLEARYPAAKFGALYSSPDLLQQMAACDANKRFTMPMQYAQMAQ